MDTEKQTSNYFLFPKFQLILYCKVFIRLQQFCFPFLAKSQYKCIIKKNQIYSKARIACGSHVC